MSEKKRVLIVDDEADCREFAQAIVEEMGDFDISTARDGESGIEEARKCRPDLVILDVMMPKKDGFAVFGELRQDTEMQEIPIIMLTGVSEQSGIKFSGKDMGEFIGKEPAAFIDKPVQPEVLEAAVRDALGL